MKILLIVIGASIIFGPFGFFGAIAFLIWAYLKDQGKKDVQVDNSDNSISEIKILTPYIDVLCHFALKHEPEWVPEKVRYIRDFFENIYKNENDRQYLKDRLKLKSRPGLDYSISEVCKLNLDLDGRKTLFHAVVNLLTNTCTEINKIETDSLKFGASINLDRSYCKAYLNEVFANFKKEEISKDSEIEKAAKILGVSVNATMDEVQKAYRLKIREFHPDRNINVTASVKSILEEKTHLINEARDIFISNR